MRINTELAIGLILVLSIFLGIFTVVGFDKTNDDLEKINAAVAANQAALNEMVKSLPKK